jgi:hypothetical protein
MKVPLHGPEGQRVPCENGTADLRHDSETLALAGAAPRALRSTAFPRLRFFASPRPPEPFYLIAGAIVQVVQEDATSGMSQIRTAEIEPDVWTLTKFLSRRPIRNTYGVIETPETLGQFQRR